ncbi:MAG: flagellar basal body-associated FliL family protein [Nitrospirae bacterium]|nr:flagellar basal body-associated FliL family protein [Nitrospirota bacterium]MBF0535444.1 flagellar basal body-associated FliL family protein [Nitrospirota bacterium]MBF0617632.1 flagellar basal body-associated FliL family protein [Nitrospirota bacterium]
MSKEEQDEEQLEGPQPKKKLNIKQLIIFLGIALVLVGAGYIGYNKFLKKHDNTAAEPEKPVEEKVEKKEKKAHKEPKKEGHDTGAIVPLEPFVVNLVDPGRYMKITVQIEIPDKKMEAAMKEKLPVLRDAIIILLSSKNLESISGPDGKLMLKDEMLARVNQALGEDLITNIYFTDFVVQ